MSKVVVGDWTVGDDEGMVVGIDTDGAGSNMMLEKS